MICCVNHIYFVSKLFLWWFRTSTIHPTPHLIQQLFHFKPFCWYKMTNNIWSNTYNVITACSHVNQSHNCVICRVKAQKKHIWFIWKMCIYFTPQLISNQSQHSLVFPCVNVSFPRSHEFTAKCINFITDASPKLQKKNIIFRNWIRDKLENCWQATESIKGDKMWMAKLRQFILRS